MEVEVKTCKELYTLAVANTINFCTNENACYTGNSICKFQPHNTIGEIREPIHILRSIKHILTQRRFVMKF